MGTSRVVFAGTPDFALASLKALVDADIRPLVVLTQPDRPAGRGRKLVPGPVKAYALDLDLDVMQPETLKDAGIVRRIAENEPDVMIVAAYGLILPQAVLDLPRRGALNVHASLLPRWRGAAPIQAAILAGDAETGISLMRMEAGLDTGPVYLQEKIDIGDNDTAGDVHDRLAALGGALLVQHLDAILCGAIMPEPQDESAATYAGKIRASDALVDWTRPAAELRRSVRAYSPVPGARFRFNDEMIKVWRSEAGDSDGHPAGTVLEAGTRGIEVACGQGSLTLTELQRPGRRPVSAGEFAAQFELVGKRFE